MQQALYELCRASLASNTCVVDAVMKVQPAREGEADAQNRTAGQGGQKHGSGRS